MWCAGSVCTGLCGPPPLGSSDTTAVVSSTTVDASSRLCVDVACTARRNVTLTSRRSFTSGDAPSHRPDSHRMSPSLGPCESERPLVRTTCGEPPHNAQRVQCEPDQTPTRQAQRRQLSQQKPRHKLIFTFQTRKKCLCLLLKGTANTAPRGTCDSEGRAQYNHCFRGPDSPRV